MREKIIRPKKLNSPICNFMLADVEGFDSLAELALDMRWSWNHSADHVWKQLDPVFWDLTHNPWVVLQTVSRDRLQRLLSDKAFRKTLDDLIQARRQANTQVTWFQQEHSKTLLTCVAYFSMEFMLSEALPIYSGGLGNVAGDQLKAASDLGVPVIGVGLLYQQGYFRQVIDKNGSQRALFPYNDPGQLPVTPLREPNAEWLRLEIAFPGYSLWLRAWQVEVGRAKLYLLDSNDPANFPAHRGITGELYGGGSEIRLMQEIILGIAGWRLLGKIGIRPEVCHLNEGHAAFAVLERALSYMKESGRPFDVALNVTRAGNLFTTHTPVAAGFDSFAPSLVKQYLGDYARNSLGISVDDLLALGRQNPGDSMEDFNMAYLAIRGSSAVNSVSRLHREVSRSIFQPLFPRWPECEIPIGHVTNGVHMATWDSEQADELWTRACGKKRWLGTVETLEEKIRQVPDSTLWEARTSARRSLIKYVRERLSRQLSISGGTHEEVEYAKHVFDANTLTLGFARRFATYKRPNLLLHDPDRLLRLLSDRVRPVQLIIAGKAHPADKQGQSIIEQWMKFILHTDARKHVIFLSDYDMLLTEKLVQGVDVWINTPRRPWEACGTSGMKVLVNGGLNLSELDGWWAEAYTPEVGWALGDGMEHGDDPAWDSVEAEELYNLIERNVIPEFYERYENNIPVAWVARIRESMARLTPLFSANRAVEEYTRKYYIPAASSYKKRAAQKSMAGIQIVNWKKRVESNWADIRFGEVNHVTKGDGHLFMVQVYLNGIDPDIVHVELYAEGINGEPVRKKMMRVEKLEGAENGYVYSTRVPSNRPYTDYTARVIPFNPDVAVPLEISKILWQR
jgi:starch phosphorylase